MSHSADIKGILGQSGSKAVFPQLISLKPDVFILIIVKTVLRIRLQTYLDDNALFRQLIEQPSEPFHTLLRKGFHAACFGCGLEKHGVFAERVSPFDNRSELAVNLIVLIRIEINNAHVDAVLLVAVGGTAHDLLREIPERPLASLPRNHNIPAVSRLSHPLGFHLVDELIVSHQPVGYLIEGISEIMPIVQIGAQDFQLDGAAAGQSVGMKPYAVSAVLGIIDRVNGKHVIRRRRHLRFGGHFRPSSRMCPVSVGVKQRRHIRHQHMQQLDLQMVGVHIVVGVDHLHTEGMVCLSDSVSLRQLCYFNTIRLQSQALFSRNFMFVDSALFVTQVIDIRH